MTPITPLHATARQRWWARWMLAVMLLASLAPTVSRAMMASHGGAGWVELCTSVGTRWVQLTDVDGASGVVSEVATSAEMPASSDAVHPLDACGYCVLASERFAPLVPVLPAVVAHAPTLPPPVFEPAEHARPVAVRLVARGPPAV